MTDKMTDFDTLIDNVVESAKECENEHEHRGFYTESIKKNHDAARSALREAIAEVVAQNDGFRLMMQSETLEKLDKAELILIIHGWHNKDHSYQCDIARLEAQLKEADAALELAMPLLQEDVYENDSILDVCIYCHEEIVSGEEHKEDCQRLVAYQAVYSRLSKRGQG